MASTQKKIQHLFLRATFGETPDRINSLLDTPISSIVDKLFTTSNDFQDIDYLPSVSQNNQKYGMGSATMMKMYSSAYNDMEELNGEWIVKMSNTQAVLREKMTFFWHNHFATSTPFGYLMQVQNNTLRKYALGKFGDMLHAVAKDAAMIIYLNNQQNTKEHPNENFAREVMELFTLGVENYTEKDVKEAARAFTGWAVNASGEYEFHDEVHDSDEKEFLGQKGNFNGDDILNIILSNKQLAVFVVTKIYREFVNPCANAERVQQLADSFFNSGYDISVLMRQIFTSDWFYDDENIGVKVCSPVELIVRYKKLMNINATNKQTLLNVQKALGQVLFFPPNVAGWKGGKNWIDSSSLLLRLSIPSYVIRGKELIIVSKPYPEEKPDDKPQDNTGSKIDSDWTALENAFKKLPAEIRLESMLDYFIQCDASRIDRNLLKTNWTDKEKDNLTYSMAAIMSLPEFQLI